MTVGKFVCFWTSVPKQCHMCVHYLEVASYASRRVASRETFSQGEKCRHRLSSICLDTLGRNTFFSKKHFVLKKTFSIFLLAMGTFLSGLEFKGFQTAFFYSSLPSLMTFFIISNKILLTC